MTEKEIPANEQEAEDLASVVAPTENTSDENNLESLESPENTAKIAELQKQLEEAKSKYIYLLSDFENYKRNAAKDRGMLIQTAGSDILAAMLPILDDFDRAAKNGALTDGTSLIQQKFSNVLKNKGLVRMELNPGEAFNPDQQEAIAEIPAPNEDAKGKIVDILEPGYFLGEKILRFAKVVVGR